MSTPDRARQLRRRSVHERQAVVFGVLLATLAVGGLVSAAVFSGALHLSFFDRGFSVQPTAAAARVPCPPAGTLPVAADKVTVNVLNASSQVGLASQTAQSLGERGFAIATTGNSQTAVTGVAKIVFGAGGIAQAYTLAAHVKGATLSFDRARSDATVDLLLGSSFISLTAVEKVALDPATPLVAPTGCVPLAQLTASPTAS
jgi:hypothetical protein